VTRTIIGIVGLAITVAFVTPVAIAGVLVLLEGDYLTGGALLGLAALAILIEEYVTSPTDVPVELTQWAVGKVVTEPHPDEEDDTIRHDE